MYVRVMEDKGKVVDDSSTFHTLKPYRILLGISSKGGALDVYFELSSFFLREQIEEGNEKESFILDY